MRIIRLKIGIIMLCIIIFFTMEYQVSKYGNSIYFTKYPLKYNTEFLVLREKKQISYDGGWGYIMEDENYTVKDSITLHIKKILGYIENKNNLVIQIEDQNNKIIYLVFESLDDIYNKTPKIYDHINHMVNNSKINLDNIPSYIPIWRYVRLFLILSIILCSFSLLYSLIKLIFHF